MQDDNNKNKYNKMWIAIVIAVIVLLIGFYLYTFYPKIIPGMASIDDNSIRGNLTDHKLKRPEDPENNDTEDKIQPSDNSQDKELEKNNQNILEQPKQILDDNQKSNADILDETNQTTQNRTDRPISADKTSSEEDAKVSQETELDTTSDKSSDSGSISKDTEEVEHSTTENTGEVQTKSMDKTVDQTAPSESKSKPKRTIIREKTEIIKESIKDNKDVSKIEESRDKSSKGKEDDGHIKSQTTKEDQNLIRNENQEISNKTSVDTESSESRTEKPEQKRLETEKLVQSEETNTENNTQDNKTSDKKAQEKQDDSEEDKGFFQRVKEGISDFAENVKEGILNIIHPTLQKDINVLVIGIDDLDSVTKGKIEADAVVLAKLHPDDNTFDLYNIQQNQDLIYGEEINDQASQQIESEIEVLTETDIDYYFTISYQGFIKLVNDLDGIELTLDDALKVPGLELNLKAGKNQLSGEETLSYARWYDHKKDERDRIHRQQQVIGALIKKAFLNKTIFDLPQLFKTTLNTFNMVNTDLDYSMITKIVTFFNQSDEIKINYNIIISE